MSEPREPQEPIRGDEELPELSAELLEAARSTGVTDGGTSDMGPAPHPAQAGEGSVAHASTTEEAVVAAPSVAGASKPPAAAAKGSTPAAPHSKATVPTAASAGDAGDMPYVDDPVSKWWVGLIVAVFAVIFVWAIFLGDAFDGLFEGAGPTPAPSAAPTLGASPVASATAQPTVAATPASSVAATPDAIVTATPEAPVTAAPPTAAPATPAIAETQAPASELPNSFPAAASPGS